MNKIKRYLGGLAFLALAVIFSGGGIQAKAMKLSAESAVVMDVQSGAILYQKNMDKQEYPASITKVMTAMLAIENSSLDEVVTYSAKALQLELAQMPDALQMAYRDSAPNVICAYAYELAGAVNRFYHETRILAEPDKQKQAGYLALIRLARRALEECIDLLGFSAPDRM